MSTDLYSAGDLYTDYLLKKEYYTFMSLKHPKNALMLTKCYFNKKKYNVRYSEDIENLL